MKIILSLLTLGLLGSAFAQTRLLSWDMSNCSDAQGSYVNFDPDGQVVMPGLTRSCYLKVNSVPYNSEIVRADFQYELIYKDNFFGPSLEKKIILPGTDTVMYDGRSAQGVELIQDWSVQDSSSVHTAWFYLPLSINAQSRVRYTYVGMKGVLIFSDGTRKQVYQRLPIVYP